MKAATSFREVLDLRGRILLFTPNALVGLRFEQMAERHHAQVVHTRGWLDKWGPLGIWQRIHASRDYAVLSCDQKTYITGVRIPATDVVWVGPMGDPRFEESLWARFSQAMGRPGDDPNVRLWTCGEDAA